MRVSEIINEVRDYKWVQATDRDGKPTKYARGAYYDSEWDFNDDLMNNAPGSWKHTAALKSPNHPVTGKPGMSVHKFRMQDKRKRKPEFMAQLQGALDASPQMFAQHNIDLKKKDTGDGGTAVASKKTILDPNRAKLSTADIAKTQPTSVASREQPPEQASTERPPAPKNVRKMPLHPATKKAWIRQYGKTHNPDGTPK
jgi:hypothetical protein